MPCLTIYLTLLQILQLHFYRLACQILQERWARACVASRGIGACPDGRLRGYNKVLPLLWTLLTFTLALLTLLTLTLTLLTLLIDIVDGRQSTVYTDGYSKATQILLLCITSHKCVFIRTRKNLFRLFLDHIKKSEKKVLADFSCDLVQCQLPREDLDKW